MPRANQREVKLYPTSAHDYPTLVLGHPILVLDYITLVLDHPASFKVST